MEVVRDGLLDRYPAATVEKILWDNLYRLYAEVIG
jgi:microsomal dipeptidase-like Zn-dependent dipeptidase